MKVDIHSLGVFSQLAREGSHHAADSLSQLTGIDVFVDVTNITLLSPDDLRESFDDEQFVGVQIGFDGQFEGETVLVFKRENIGALLEYLLPGSYTGDGIDEFAKSGVKEVGNIMMSGFIDGWADHLGTAIDMTPPTYVEREGTDVLPQRALESGEEVFLFESRLETLDRDVNFFIYMFPEYGAMTELMSLQREDDDEAIPVDKLSVFNQMTKQGAKGAAENISMMTGVDTEVDVSRLSFVPIEDAPNHVGDDRFAGVVIGFQGMPSGYLLILFDEASARTVAETMLPMETEGDGLGDMERGAIKELGNVMTSGFIDGWANVLQTSIDHTPPQFVHDMGSAIVSPVVGRLGQSQDFAFMIDSTVRTEREQFRCELYALPDEAELKRALETLDVDRAGETKVDADQYF
ncbi:chemotaxis protein CheC [Halogranum gelatinilyticum]|uniref:Chemotaxis protein CheC n=1 Tax=Halogranum gelatinilyticum TaxID=660521 RepID=A0A1G9R4P0_9EURY|nr:chemotaxis protein CheC [Halogranum gelatinilyticum]SDM17797.1 chemotaxis protein CheC [Halogranum gelatinilyticum]